MPKLISTDRAPLAIGPYAQAVRTESLLFISGQLPVDPGTGTLIPGDVSAQTHQCLKNLSAIASAAGLSLKQAVKVTVFLTDMADFPSINAVYSIGPRWWMPPIFSGPGWWMWHRIRW